MTDEQKKKLNNTKKDKEELNTKELGDEILYSNRNITGSGRNIISDNTGETYIYNLQKGFWEWRNSIKLLEHVINQKLGYQTSSGLVSEVVKYIQRESYKDYLLRDITKEGYVCLDNGVLNLNKMERVNQSPNFCFTYNIPVAYDPTADPELFRTYLRQINPKNVETIEEEIGLILCNGYPIKKLIYALGKPHSGKSTLYKILMNWLGVDNYSSISIHQLGETFINADIYDKRANFNSETTYKLTLGHIGTLKAFTGGGIDSVTLQKKHKDPFKCINIAKLFFAGNGIPNIDTDKVDDAFYGRWQIDEYPYTFPIDDIIVPKYSTWTMKSAILNSAISGYKRLKENKWHFTNETPFDTVVESFEGAVYELDTFDKWLSNTYQSCDGEHYEFASDMFRNCREWHEQQGLKTYPLNITEFGKRMTSQKLIPVSKCQPLKDGHQQYAYRGIKIRQQDG